MYSTLLTLFIYRTMTWEMFPKAAAKAVKTTGVVRLPIGVSAHVPVPDGSLPRGEPWRLASVSTNPWVISPHQPDPFPARHVLINCALGFNPPPAGTTQLVG